MFFKRLLGRAKEPVDISPTVQPVEAAPTPTPEPEPEPEYVVEGVAAPAVRPAADAVVPAEVTNAEPVAAPATPAWVAAEEASFLTDMLGAALPPQQPDTAAQPMPVQGEPPTSVAEPEPEREPEPEPTSVPVPSAAPLADPAPAQADTIKATREDVVAAYKLFLGRLPESDAVVEARLGKPVLAVLAEFLTCDEYRANVQRAQLAVVVAQRWLQERKAAAVATTSTAAGTEKA